MKTTQSKTPVIIFLLSLVFLVGFESGFAAESDRLTQDLGVLTNSNGKIVEQKTIKVKSKWSAGIECYKIKHLSDGLKVVGFVLKPKDEGRKYPVMIFNRGGNREYFKITKKGLIYLTYLSSKNYVILASQYRGNDGGQGREEFGGKDVNDVLNLIPLAKSLPFTDPSRMVMYGISRGGMMTYLAIKEGAQIKAAAVLGGITDLIQTYKEREDMKEGVLDQLIGPLKWKEAEYKKRSAYYWPEKINVPVIILHGGEDWRVKASQATKLSEKLKELGKPHKLVIIPEGNHLLGKHKKKRNKEIFEWFNKYIK